MWWDQWKSVGQIHAGVGNRARLQLILFQISTGVGLDLLGLEGFTMTKATCINNVGIEDKDIVLMDKIPKHYIS